MPGRCGRPPRWAHRLRRQRTRTAKHRRGVALERTRLAERTLSLRTRKITGRGLRRTWRRRHDARRLRHHLALRLQRRRARRRLAGFFDAQTDARRHEAAGGLLAHGLDRFSAGGRDCGRRGLGRCDRLGDRRRRLDDGSGAASATGGAAGASSCGGRRCFDRRGRDSFVRRRFGGPGLLDQARRTERRRGGLRRLGCGEPSPFLPGGRSSA